MREVAPMLEWALSLLPCALCLCAFCLVPCALFALCDRVHACACAHVPLRCFPLSCAFCGASSAASIPGATPSCACALVFLLSAVYLVHDGQDLLQLVHNDLLLRRRLAEKRVAPPPGNI